MAKSKAYMASYRAAKGGSSGSSSQPMTPEQALAATNPHYSEGREWQVTARGASTPTR